MNRKNQAWSLISVGIILLSSGLFVSFSPSKAAEPMSVSIDRPVQKVSENQFKGNKFLWHIYKMFDFENRPSMTLLSVYTEGKKTVPELVVRLRIKSQEKDYHFGVECVWRKNMPEKELEWISESGLNMLKDYEKNQNRPVYVIIGIGGEPNNPESIYIVPLSEKPYRNIYTSSLLKYKSDKVSGKFYYEADKKHLFIK